jgi:alkylation response protein AidB-like acyl-CoA dehydrogenase
VLPLDTIAGDHQCEVAFGDVEIGPESRLTADDANLSVVEKIMQRGAVAECARMTGMSQHMLEMAVAFCKERIVYEKTLDNFQVIQHRCADMLVNVEASRYVTYNAAWRIGRGLTAAREAAMAKAWTSDACQSVCAEASHIHGAIGFTDTHDAQLFLRRAKAAELAFGDSGYQTAFLAQTMQQCPPSGADRMEGTKTL